ncbi:MAG: ATP-grasp domain-containing protein [Gammaproteobacteria bacterium]|uniref:acetyl/propionyl/methylcrotonyl-CoA carboxylase subunit alpha n=1 Tax=Rhodoferax sp. TaxID=50421 RepID=UPI0017E886CC|nr:biotin carboxylase N-terminal domain-containing protein [Rhodoferax sp.]MBU3899815.1 ATP-grasp domain-containing protein [Gammaproteobacteria bacterium]MBA3059841.1 ATP-grasp domain-containing protein [Rhodoferax sp.]MBU3998846.1 ATP-grasp domain-containing protein [Gammaproteobacteria bacterium]MBU4019079.1 ATP-grasp domain-containing protein [Gammaproteobacteria bacterium]MBU4078798.1 ATP-grasp domain-containing protein [Gammaproteobacteria bacterium]
MIFSKILIANRGEIACRVMRTARNLGYRTVAVYSDADRDAPHVRLADEAVHIGGSAPADSYLRVDALLEAARKTGADAIHPGYGFLSENAGFAQACLDAALVFIGPPPAAMLAMGDKALAKRRMMAAGVPCAPGYLGEEQDDTRLTEEALKLGFPLLVKAVAGGGGRGMRLVRSADEIAQAIVGARREAQGAFGDAALMLERLIDNGRHIEIQVFADDHGNAVYLGERDCTAQRRRQKVIEEAPSPVVNSAMREAMGRDAVAAALAVGYRGAGTVEFIVDGDLKHYFLEMNTRLQVEHPVTELVTGFDLVEWQLRVAAGQPLPASQTDIKLTGHAIEARLYVEDPYAGFAPQTGTVRWWRPQQALFEGVRIDAGIEEGSEVSPYYDPMVAKVIVHGRDRDDAIRRLRAALENAPLLGLRNNARFLADLVNHPAFRSAAMTTTTIDQWQEAGEALLQRPVPGDQAWCVAAAAFAMQNGANWRADSVAAFDIPLRCDELTHTLRVHPERTGQVAVTLAGQTHRVRIIHFKNGDLRYEIDGVTRSAIALKRQQELHLAMGGNSFVFHEVSPFPSKDAALDATRALSPVAGKVTQIQFAVGEGVREGQALVCVEAMKMEMWLTAQAAGTVVALHVKVGEQVESGALLIEIELEEKENI